jgi:hypothetical protein
MLRFELEELTHIRRFGRCYQISTSYHSGLSPKFPEVPRSSKYLQGIDLAGWPSSVSEGEGRRDQEHREHHRNKKAANQAAS